MNADSPTPNEGGGPVSGLRSRPLAAQKPFAASGDKIALQIKSGNDPGTFQASTPERKRSEYLDEASPTIGGGCEHSSRDTFVPIPEGVGRQDLDDLSELLKDPSLTAEDLAEILETLDISSAKQARSESWAATRTIARTQACINSCIAQLNDGMCITQPEDVNPNSAVTSSSTSLPTLSHTNHSRNPVDSAMKSSQTLTSAPTKVLKL